MIIGAVIVGISVLAVIVWQSYNSNLNEGFSVHDLNWDDYWYDVNKVYRKSVN